MGSNDTLAIARAVRRESLGAKLDDLGTLVVTHMMDAFGPVSCEGCGGVHMLADLNLTTADEGPRRSQPILVCDSCVPCCSDGLVGAGPCLRCFARAQFERVSA